MTATFTNTSKNISTLTNAQKGSLGLTWEQATRAWNSAAAQNSTWAFPIAAVTNLAKNAATVTNTSKN